MPVMLVTKEDYNKSIKNQQKQNFTRPNKQFNSSNKTREPFVNFLLEPKFKQRTFDTTNKHIEFLKRSNPKIMFLGDSIFEKFKSTGRNIWLKNQLGKKEIFNAGIGGDKLENILYRIEIMDLFKNIDQLDNIIIFAGTNNLERDQPRNMIESLKKIIDLTQQTFPSAKITVLGLVGLISSDTGNIDIITRKTIEFNNLISKIDNINFVSMRERFYKDNVLSEKYFSDNINLNESGYDIFGDVITTII
jgi:lysophospholipase L1-like esterase